MIIEGFSLPRPQEAPLALRFSAFDKPDIGDQWTGFKQKKQTIGPLCLLQSGANRHKFSHDLPFES
jgi:hypothetical protein